MSQSLGFRRGCDHIAEEHHRPSPRRGTLPAPKAPEPKPMRMMVLKGFVPLFLVSSFFFVLPLLFFYADPDYTTAGGRGGVIALASVAGLAVVMVNDTCTIFNIVLGLHTAVEVRVLDVLMDFAKESTTSDSDEVLAWCAFGVIIAHLLPFFLMDKRMLLALLGVIGIPVNAAALVYLEPTLLLAAGLSSTALLGAVLSICYSCSRRCAIVPLFVKTMTTGKWISCAEYEC